MSHKQMISSEAPIVLAKACEVFIQELTFRAWIRAEANKKRTLQHCDIAMAIKKDKVFNFLKNVADCGHDHDAVDSRKVFFFLIFIYCLETLQ